MANIMSSMKIPIQKLVSKKKKRYTQDGFNLDLTYILPNLIAMGFPANKIEGVYRNHIDEVFKFFESKHDGVYKIYNLCSERRYDISKFHSRVATYPFHDHNPPNIEQIQAFCDDVHNWLSGNHKHIAAVHCKAGKGRTGTMICCYMLHNRKFTCAADALRHYGEQRTYDQKGVTIPSQRRYVEYYSHLLKSGKIYTRIPLQICEIKLSSPPLLNNHPGIVHFSIFYVKDSKECNIFTFEVPDVKKSTNSDGCLVIRLDQCIPLAGDIKVEFYKGRSMRKKSILFRFWFNTYFVNELCAGEDSCNPYLELFLIKNELDYAHKDKQNKLYPPEFKVQVTLQRTPSGSYVRGADQHVYNNHHSNMSMNCIPDTPSESPEASSSGSSTGEDWESGEFKSNEHVEKPKQRKHNSKTKLVKTNVIAATKPPQQFKAKTSNIKIITNGSSSMKKMRWLSNMRSDPDFRDSLAKNVMLRTTRQSNDSLNMDYYSQVCDNQLSVGSPCKSPSELMIKSQQTNSCNRNHSSITDECRPSDSKVLVVAKPVESQSIGFNVDNNLLASEKLSLTLTTPSLYPSRPPPLSSSSSSSLPSPILLTESSLIKIHSPISHHMSGLPCSNNITNSNGLNNHQIPATSVHQNLNEDPLELENIQTRNKRSIWSDNSFKHKFFGKSVNLSQIKSNTHLPAEQHPNSDDFDANNPCSGGSVGTASFIPEVQKQHNINNNNDNNNKRSSFTFRDIRQELRSVIRQNSSTKK